MSRVITFKASEKLVEDMDKLARELGITRSELIKRAIAKYIAEKMTEKEKPKNVRIRKVVVY